MTRHRPLIIGCGIVGLACALRLAEEGRPATIVDRDPRGDRASLGNAGGIAVTEVTPISSADVWTNAPRWLLDPLGPLAIRWTRLARLLPWLRRFERAGRGEAFRRISAALAALNGRTYEDLEPMLRSTGLSGSLRKSGALVVYESAGAARAARAEWERKRALGIRFERLTRDEILEMEPRLAHVFDAGVFTPDWGLVGDPKQVVEALQRACAERGCEIVAGEVAGFDRGEDGRVVAARFRDGRRLRCESVVVAAGAWSGALARALGDKVVLESERGYNTTLPAETSALSREVVFAERKFVASPLTPGLRIGGGAEFAGLAAPANPRRAEALLRLGRRYIRNLDETGATQWMGQRPATPDSLPVIGSASRARNALYAFGHGHLGLTQAATTARLIADMIVGRPAILDSAPYGIERFAR